METAMGIQIDILKFKRNIASAGHVLIRIQKVELYASNLI